MNAANEPRLALLLAMVLLGLSWGPLAWSWELVKGQIRWQASWEETPIAGGFERFEAVIRFDPAAPESGEFEVRVDTASASTGIPDIDQELGEPDWFSAGTHPEAVFRSSSVTPTAEGFDVTGTLELKGHSRELHVPITWAAEDRGAQLTSQFVLDRTDFSIGSGEWRHDEFLAWPVQVEVDLELK